MTAEDRVPDKTKGAALLAIIGCTVVIVGTFVTWISVTVQGFDSTSPESGIKWDGTTAAWMIGLAGIAALTALGEITGWAILPSWISRSVIIDGTILVWFTGAAMSEASKSGTVVYAGQSLHYQRHIGAGLWMCMVGAGVVIVAGYTLIGGVSGVWRGSLLRASMTQKRSDPSRNVGP